MKQKYAAMEGIVRSIGLAAVRFQGFVDAIERGVVYGWAWNPQRPEEPVQVEILLGQKQLAVVTADRFRDDLIDLEIGDGRHAFEYVLPDGLVGQVETPEIEVRYAGSEVPLPRMQVRPQRRARPDGAPRPETEMIAVLQQRISMQEQVINDMSNLLRGMAERFRDLPAPGGAVDRPVAAELLQAMLEQQSQSLQVIETYMVTFGQSLREIAETSQRRDPDRLETGGRFRAMDAFFLVLLALVVVGFAVVFGEFY